MIIRPQKSSLSCLSTCLLTLLRQEGIRVKNSEESEMLLNALKFTKYDFALGHLDYISRKFNKNANYFVESTSLFRLLRRINKSKKLRIFCKKVDHKFILQKLKEGPVMVYLDNHYLSKSKIHSPHFVIVTEKINDKFKILDPWDGKEKLIHEDVFMIAVRSLWDYLWYSTALITIPESKKSE